MAKKKEKEKEEEIIIPRNATKMMLDILGTKTGRRAVHESMSILVALVGAVVTDVIQQVLDDRGIMPVKDRKEVRDEED